MPVTRLSSFIVACLCVLVVWAPIPLGSNRPWAWSILEIALACLFALHLLHYLRSPWPLTVLRWQLPLLMPLLILQVYVALQAWQVLPSVDPYAAEKPDSTQF